MSVLVTISVCVCVVIEYISYAYLHDSDKMKDNLHSNPHIHPSLQYPSLRPAHTQTQNQSFTLHYM